MKDILDEGQIAALFEAARSGSVPESEPATPRRNPRLRTVDFTRPTKFSSDHQRRISRAFDTFCVTASTRLGAELRAPVELETISTTQLTWSGAQSMLPSRSLSVTLEAEPLGTRLLLMVETSFVLSGIECLLGGAPTRPPKERRFSEIDWSLSRRLLESLVSQLSVVWRDLGGLSFNIEDIDLHNDASAIAPVSEPTFVVVLEVRLSKMSSSLALLVPWASIEPVADRIASRDPLGAERQADQAVAEALATVPVTLRAEVGSVQMPVADVLSLAPGTVIPLRARAADGVSLFAENVLLGRAEPGASGARRALKIRGRQEF